MRLRLTGVSEGRFAGAEKVWWFGPRLAILVLLIVIGLGTAGYVLIEGWSAWDAFYMTIITVTTVGYREVHPMSRGGEMFTAALLVAGVGALFYTASLIMALLVEGELHHRWRLRRLDRMISELSSHFIVCGFGRIGAIVADEFRRQNVPFVIVERNPERKQQAVDAGYLAVEGDSSSEDSLKRVGILRARGLIAAVGTDAENVYTVLSARLLKPDLFVLSRAETEDARRKLVRAGADRVVSPYQIGALQLAQSALRPAVVDFVHLATSSDNLDLSMEQVRLDPASPLAERSILESNLRQRFGVIVVGIQRADGRLEFNPPPDVVLHGGDHLVVLGRPSSLRELEASCANTP